MAIKEICGRFSTFCFYKRIELKQDKDTRLSLT